MFKELTAGVLATMLLLPKLGLAQDARASGASEAPADFRVPRDQLSSQEDAPFLFAGQVMNETRVRWGEYEDALRDHPDMLSCLVPEARDDPAPDLAQSYDWLGIEGDAASDVCLFRLAVSLRTPARVEAWMLAQGMWRARPGEYNRDYNWPNSDPPVITGNWQADEVCERTRILGWFGCLVQPRLGTFYLFNVIFDDNGQIRSANVNGTGW